MEDDVDWDIGVKSQLRRFAQAVRLLIHPLPATIDQFLNPTYPRPRADQAYPDFFVDDYDVSKPKDPFCCGLAICYSFDHVIKCMPILLSTCLVLHCDVTPPDHHH